MDEKKKRAEWRGKFDDSTDGRIHALATLATKIDPPSDPPSMGYYKTLRWKLIGKGTFNEALDALLVANAVNDLTDAERAYCEGWAAHARQIYTDPKEQDQALIDAINAAIAIHKSDDGSGVPLSG